MEWIRVIDWLSVCSSNAVIWLVVCSGSRVIWLVVCSGDGLHDWWRCQVTVDSVWVLWWGHVCCIHCWGHDGPGLLTSTLYCTQVLIIIIIIIIIITKHLYCAIKCRCKLSSACFSATVKLGTKRMCHQRFSILLKLDKQIEQYCKSLGREFHAAGAEKLKLRFPNLFVRKRDIFS